MPGLQLGASLLVGRLVRVRDVGGAQTNGARKVELVGGGDVRGLDAPRGTHPGQAAEPDERARPRTALLELGHDFVKERPGRATMASAFGSGTSTP